MPPRSLTCSSLSSPFRLESAKAFLSLLSARMEVGASNAFFCIRFLFLPFVEAVCQGTVHLTVPPRPTLLTPPTPSPQYSGDCCGNSKFWHALPNLVYLCMFCHPSSLLASQCHFLLQQVRKSSSDKTTFISPPFIRQDPAFFLRPSSYRPSKFPS